MMASAMQWFWPTPRSENALKRTASHGTHEFYCERAEITKRLIAEKNFTAVAVEADWPDAYRLNRYVRGASDDVDAVEALSLFSVPIQLLRGLRGVRR
jgi:hypothetical protein